MLYKEKEGKIINPGFEREEKYTEYTTNSNEINEKQIRKANDFIAEPIFDKKNNVWNISVETNGEKIKIGHKVNNLLFNYLKFNNKEDAIKYIKNDKKLILKRK